MVAKAKERGEENRGITIYLGGAGPIGHVGSWDVPRGLAEAGYEGYVEVFNWQGITHAGDQLNISRNHIKAAELAAEIRSYRRRYPGQKINIIALSAGTGIATFALEYLPEGVEVDHVVFLGCSLSANYDMTRALRRVRTGLYCLYSMHDAILKNVVWYTGTVDRSAGDEGIAGLEGFHAPRYKGKDTERLYQKLFNVPHRAEFAEFGYSGTHTDGTKQEFVRAFLGPLVLGDDSILRGNSHTERRPSPSRVTTRPASTASEIRYGGERAR